MNSGTSHLLQQQHTFHPNHASGELNTQYGKAVTVWRKQVDGAWKCVIDTWNCSPVERVLSAAGPAT